MGPPAASSPLSTFCKTASARQIAKLLADGVGLSEIIRAVSQISRTRLRLEVEQPGTEERQNGTFRIFAHYLTSVAAEGDL